MCNALIFLIIKKNVFTKVLEEVKVYGFIMKSLNSCHSCRYVVKHVSYECCKNEPLMPLKTMSIFSSVLGVLYILVSNFTII